MSIDDSNGTSNGTDAHVEKRRFTRVPFVTQIELTTHEGSPAIEGTVVDISIKGILINIETPVLINSNTQVAARIYFDNGINITIGVELAHHHSTLYGFSITQIDLDGISHLRNIVMHNLDDDAACERELMALFRYHQ